MHRLRRTVRIGLPALLAVLFWAATVAPCDTPPIPRARWGTLRLPSGAALNVEIADTPELIQRGYMFRDHVPEGEGMVFFLENLDIHPFWMKNCRIALDIVWLDEQWRVVQIAESLPPCKADPCPSYMPIQRSHYVLEVAGGRSSALGLKLGDRLSFLPPAPPQK
jgi:uncharacterized membrane protein (UPF0127 family)